MDSAWLSMSVDDLIRQAEICQKLASHVHNRELSGRLASDAAQLLAEAQRKSAHLNGKPHMP